ncbi:MAG: hypothetical protein HZB30_03780 [Nitrospirae bacterium]|nr:hypothetical protein [Nitrospirota bacterium]
MDKGTILFHRALEFKNGETGKKLLIILNTPQSSEPFLCCKTTSKQKYGLDKEGCYSSKNIYVLNPAKNCFPDKTWVQFHEIYEFNNHSFLQAHFKKDLDIKGKLPINIINAIVKCVRNSDDVLKYHLSLLR